MPPILVLGAAGAPFALATRKVATVPPVGGPLGGRRSTMPSLLHPALPSSDADYNFVTMLAVWLLQRRNRIRLCMYSSGEAYGWVPMRVA